MLNLNGRAIFSRTVSFCRYIMITLGGALLYFGDKYQFLKENDHFGTELVSKRNHCM